MRDALRELLSRRGLGALLITVCGAIALGVVPNILQTWTSAAWLMYAAFAVGVAGVLAGWALTLKQGLGIVLDFYPRSPSPVRVNAMLAESRRRHAQTAILRRSMLWPNDSGPAAEPATMEMLGRTVLAQCSGYQETGGSLMDIALYPLVPLHDAYRLGRELCRQLQDGLLIAHSAPNGTVPGLRLTATLRPSTSHTPDPLLTPYLADHRLLTPVPDADPAHRHRLALIVNLTQQSGMVTTARHVAATGDPGNSGYVSVHPCGATTVIETTAYLPSEPIYFEAMVRHILYHWRTAATAWQTETGTPTTGVLFFTGPLPIALALGWSTLDTPPEIVPHTPPPP